MIVVLDATLQNIWSLIKKLTIDSSLFFIDRNGKGEKKEKLPNFTKDIKGANLITAFKILRFFGKYFFIKEPFITSFVIHTPLTSFCLSKLADKDIAISNS